MIAEAQLILVGMAVAAIAVITGYRMLLEHRDDQLDKWLYFSVLLDFAEGCIAYRLRKRKEGDDGEI